MNNDTFTKMVVDNLSTKDAVNLCTTNKQLHDKCNKLKIYDKLLERDSPLSLPNYNSLDQLKLIDAGFSSWYGLDYTGTVSYFNGLGDRNRLFAIKGLPPPSGTKVYIIGYIILDPNETSSLTVFASRRSAINFIKYSSNPDATISWDLILDVLTDSLELYDMPEEEVTQKVLEHIEANDLISEFLVYSEITLP